MKDEGRGSGTPCCLLPAACCLLPHRLLSAALVVVLHSSFILHPSSFVSAAATSAGAQTVWELTPYRIQVVLATGQAPELSADFRADLAEGLVARVETLIGAAWDVDVIDASATFQRALIRDFETVTVERLEEELSRRLPGKEAPPSGETSAEEKPFDLDALDKVILLAALPGETGYRVVARELDVRTRQWNATVSVHVWQAAKLRDASFRAVWKAFAPLAQIVAVDKNQVTLRLRAAGFPTRDGSIVLVRPGQVFEPVIRHNDRNGKLRAASPVPWTFLTADQPAQGATGVLPVGEKHGQDARATQPSASAGFTCTLHTGLRTPLSGRRRGRFEQLAIAVGSTRQPTRLILQSRTDPHEVLPDYDVYSHPPDSKSTEPVGRTDRQGSVIIPPGEHTLRVLLIKNGGEFLARLPLVPGREAEVTAAIANDNQRLEAEGFITGLQEELIDLVTRREVLLVQANQQIDQKKFDEAEKLVRQLQGLESRDDFALHLTQEERKIFSPDKRVQAKIDAMFAKTRKLVDEYLNPNVIDQLDRQIAASKAGR